MKTSEYPPPPPHPPPTEVELTLVLLNSFLKALDPDQLASEAILSGSTLFSTPIENAGINQLNIIA